MLIVMLPETARNAIAVLAILEILIRAVVNQLALYANPIPVVPMPIVWCPLMVKAPAFALMVCLVIQHRCKAALPMNVKLMMTVPLTRPAWALDATIPARVPAVLAPAVAWKNIIRFALAMLV